MFNGVNSAMIYYYTVPEVYAKGPELSNRGIRVAGYVLPGSIKKAIAPRIKPPTTTNFSFGIASDSHSFSDSCLSSNQYRKAGIVSGLERAQ